MNTHEEPFRTPYAPLLLKLVEAAFSGDINRLEVATITVARRAKTVDPVFAERLTELLGRYRGGAMTTRGGGARSAPPTPTDSDGGLALVRQVSSVDAEEPIFGHEVTNAVSKFIEERKQSSRLLDEGLHPPRSVLISGQPGTGKTMLARWIALRLDLDLVMLDLATAISSYLGKTGANLRRSLDYARNYPCVLLLDEFDAIAKRRDDDSEVGELKRIVNVLLKELEDWPHQSVLIAATNHEELLDPAIHRRFDVKLQVPLPGAPERLSILSSVCGRFASDLPQGLLQALANTTQGMSGSHLVTAAQGAIRSHIVQGGSLTALLASAFAPNTSSAEKDELGALLFEVKSSTGLAVRELADIFEKSPSTIQYHLTKAKKAKHGK